METGIVLLVLILILVVELELRPRLDYIVDSVYEEKIWVVLWYGKGVNRRYIKIFRYTPPDE